MSISGVSYDPYDLRGYTLTPVPTGTTVCIPGSHCASVSYIPNHPDWILYACMGCVHMWYALYTVVSTPSTTMTRMYHAPYPESLLGIQGGVARTLRVVSINGPLPMTIDPMDQGLCMCHTSLLPRVRMSMYGPTAYSCCTVRRAYAWNIRVVSISSIRYWHHAPRVYTSTPVPTGTTVCIPGSHGVLLWH